MTGRFWVSQDERNTVRTRFHYQFLQRLWGAIGADYGSGLPLDFDGIYEQAQQKYGQAVIERVDFKRFRVKPSLSINGSVGADLWQKDRLARRLQFEVENLDNRLNLTNFAGLFFRKCDCPATQLQLSPGQHFLVLAVRLYRGPVSNSLVVTLHPLRCLGPTARLPLSGY